jgi:pyruvate dehydrogenase E2 component (dihydrolipoamide acetyltransferase)
MDDAAAGVTRTPLSPTRRVVARRMAESWRTIPQVTLTRTIEFEALVATRTRLAAAAEHPVSVDALVARRLALALREHPLLSGHFDEASMAVVVPDAVHVGVAVDTGHGLVAVTLRDAADRDELELARELGVLAGRARERRSRPDDLAGACVTLTNLGGLGVETFTPIVVPGQSAIVGLGAIRRASPGMPGCVSLTFDHRVADGADAARLLERLAVEIRSQ